MISLKRLAAMLPNSWQHELRRRHFQREIRRGRFYTDEKEYALLDSLLSPGDWALDIGANVGQYAMRMSQLVGPTGRVIALEPVPDTFSVLASNTRLFQYANVSLLNVAVSDRVAVVGMQIPKFTSGLSNFYQAHLDSGAGGLPVLTLPIDRLMLPRVRLVKMNVEGHELPALQGMRELISRDHPVLIVETNSPESMAFLAQHNYAVERLPGSSNLLCRPQSPGRA